MKAILKGVWQFLRPDGSKRVKLERCAYLFVPRWGRHQQDAGTTEARI